MNFVARKKLENDFSLLSSKGRQEAGLDWVKIVEWRLITQQRRL